MSYFVEDANAEWLGDFAPNAGIMGMYDDDNLPTSVKEFMENGVADEKLGRLIMADLYATGGKYPHILEIFQSAKSYPIILTDGLGYADE